MQELQEKIRENTEVSTDTGCWLWQMSCNRVSYGLLRRSGKLYLVRRLAYTAYNGEIPEGADTPREDQGNADADSMGVQGNIR